MKRLNLISIKIEIPVTDEFIRYSAWTRKALKTALQTLTQHKDQFLTRETCETTADVIRSATALLTVLISILINAQKKSQMLFLINLCKWKQCFVIAVEERRQAQDWINQVSL